MLIIRKYYLFWIKLKKKIIHERIYRAGRMINILLVIMKIRKYENNKQVFEDSIENNELVIGGKHEKLWKELNNITK